MSDVSMRRLRVHGLAAAIASAMALSALAVVPAVAAERLNLNGLQSPEPGGFDRFIVKYRNGSAQQASATSLNQSLSTAARSVAASKGGALGLSRLRRLAVGAEVVVSSTKLNAVQAETLMRQLAADPEVEYVEVDRRMYPLVTPNDSRFSEQWDLQNSTTGISATTAWDKSTGNGVVVAVIDTGITPHSDLSANLVAGYDFITDAGIAADGGGRDSDPNDPGDWTTAGQCGIGQGAHNSTWHGTHVAGTIAAVTNNSKGVAGIAYGAKVQPVRVLGKCGGYTSDIADAIIWASGGSVSGVPANATPAEVINMSLGGEGACDTTTQNAINSAVGRGATVVVAAGNSANNASQNNPANCSNVVTVGATDSAGKRSIWRAGAQESAYGTVVDVAAPGSSILSTLNSGTRTQSTETYAFYDGTSMATPHVAAVVALVQAAATAAGGNPRTPAQIESLLKSTAKPFPTTPDKPIGAGIVDAAAAVNAVAGSGGSNLAPVANFSSSVSGLTVSFTDSSTDSDGTIASRSWSFGDGTASTVASPSKTYSAAGTYTVTLTVTDNAGATSTKTASVTVSATGGGTSAQTYSNATDVAIRDYATVSSSINVSGRTGTAGSSVPIAVNIVHTYIGDLKVDLVAPDGTVYVLSNRAGGSADNIVKTYTVNLSSEALNGAWALRVNDSAFGDTGYINSWSITF